MPGSDSNTSFDARSHVTSEPGWQQRNGGCSQGCRKALHLASRGETWSSTRRAPASLRKVILLIVADSFYNAGILSSRERLRCLCFAATRVTERPIFPMVKSVRKADIIFHSVDSRCSSINLFFSTRCIDDSNGSTWRDNREYFKFLCIFRRIVNLFRVQVDGIPTVKCDCSRE